MSRPWIIVLLVLSITAEPRAILLPFFVLRNPACFDNQPYSPGSTWLTGQMHPTNQPTTDHTLTLHSLLDPKKKMHVFDTHNCLLQALCLLRFLCVGLWMFLKSSFGAFWETPPPTTLVAIHSVDFPLFFFSLPRMQDPSRMGFFLDFLVSFPGWLKRAEWKNN